MHLRLHFDCLSSGSVWWAPHQHLSQLSSAAYLKDFFHLSRSKGELDYACTATLCMFCWNDINFYKFLRNDHALNRGPTTLRNGH